ncbi:hypothetical protein BH11MYX1_BH11MYX1_41730 [soil metagenome]
MRNLLGLLVFVALGCHPQQPTELRVLGLDSSDTRHDVVLVQVTNPASHAMKLTKLEYTFAAAGTTVSAGEVRLEREVAAGAAVVVEVPLDQADSSKPMTLQGKLTGVVDQIVQTYPVEAQIAPH